MKTIKDGIPFVISIFKDGIPFVISIFRDGISLVINIFSNGILLLINNFRDGISLIINTFSDGFLFVIKNFRDGIPWVIKTIWDEIPLIINNFRNRKFYWCYFNITNGIVFFFQWNGISDLFLNDGNFQQNIPSIKVFTNGILPISEVIFRLWYPCFLVLGGEGFKPLPCLSYTLVSDHYTIQWFTIFL